MKVDTVEIRLNLPTPTKPSEETVTLLNDLLEWAKKGEVQNVMIVAQKSDGYFMSAYSDNFTVKDLIFGLYLLDSRIKEWLTYSKLE